ncbi:MAG TPA: hypothetical protein VFD33_03000 [Bacillota bacterium]|nr:hypothetical protein [Bacillota bacterium]
MSKHTINKHLLQGLSQYAEQKNQISPFATIEGKDLSTDEKNLLKGMDILNDSDLPTQSFNNLMSLLTEPTAVVKLQFTGGVGLYQHNIYHNETFDKSASITLMSDEAILTDEVDPTNILDTLAQFIGKSDLKSLEFDCEFDIEEALVIAAIIDLERKLCLRSLIDEIPYDQNLYGYNKIWRSINSTGSSIQWFVHIVNEVIGEYTTLNYRQVQDALERLVPKGLLKQKNGLYQLTDDLVFLANRMIINDNIISVSAMKQVGQDVVATGFSSIQAGIHDIIYLDYNGDDIRFRTLSSEELINNIEFFINNKDYFDRLTA